MEHWAILQWLLLPIICGAICVVAGVVILAHKDPVPTGPATWRAAADRLMSEAPPNNHQVVPRPSCWIAVKSRNVLAVRTAVGLSNPTPCSIVDGMAWDQGMFISPPVHGWILITGSDLPQPADDVDACFRFVSSLSRQLGQVHFYSANRELHHHAWVWAEHGCIRRAYAWAGQTLWKQGRPTYDERALGFSWQDYAEPPHDTDALASNAEKVPLLAARWSLDPATLGPEETYHGIAGQASRRY